MNLARLCTTGILCLLVACASRPVPYQTGTPPAPGVTAGEEIALLDAATEKVVAYMTPDGWVHLVAITTSGDACYIAVSGHGVERRETLGGDHRYGYYNNLAIAADGMGRLHVAIRDEHWILEQGNWTQAGSNPCSLLARSADSLVCAHVVEGSELGTTAEWGITGFGGGPAGIIIPYRVHPDKLALASLSDGAWSYRAVIEQPSHYSVKLENYDNGILAGDAHGLVYAFYRGSYDSGVSTRYAVLPLTAAVAPSVEWRRSDGLTMQLANFSNTPVVLPQDWYVPFGGLTFAVDPQTGMGVFFAMHSDSFASTTEGIVEIRGDIFSPPTLTPFKDSTAKKLAPAGQDRFHALVALGKSLLYLNYRHDGWSGPTRLGEFGTPSLFLIDDASIQLASDGRNDALAIWPKREGKLVGRWVTAEEPLH
jgi:hypothetical protein